MIVDNLLLAFGGIFANKVRSFLTMLSIGIGVFAVIALTAVAAGITQSAQGELDGLGSAKLISVYSYGGQDGAYLAQEESGAGGQVGGGEEGGPDAFDLFDPKSTPYVPPPPEPISAADVALLNDGTTAPDIAAATGYFQSYGQLSTEDGGSIDSEVYGTGAFYARVVGLDVLSGTFLTAGDVTSRGRVIVISQSAADNLGAAIGDTVTFQGSPFDVIGLIEDIYEGQPTSYVPETALQDVSLGPQQGYSQLYVLATDQRTVEAAADQVRQVLRRSQLLGPTDAATFDVYTRTADLRSVRVITVLFQLLAAGVASIALFVAGIGVMNIMLVTVTERTREIGIRKALGAQHRHLMGQFLLEAVVLTFTGGLLGLLAGSLLQFIEIAGFSPIVTPLSVILALSFSIATGLFFGLYPANRAASLPPIQACLLYTSDAAAE